MVEWGMRVLVTGGTGYVGSHVALALRRDGHDVRLLVRRPEQVTETFTPHGVTFAPGDVVTGDVLDAGSVGHALDGCDAVVHAAAIFSLDPRKAKAMLDTNARATRIVLTAALDRSCDPAVHISSSVALMRHGGSGPDLPLGDIEHAYSKSKVLSEIEARKLQDEGKPVVTVYPGAIFGPGDPYVGSQTERFLWVVRGRFPIWSKGGVLATDVRDTADVVAAVMKPGQGPRRYVVPGIHMTGDDLYGAVAKALGRRRVHLDVPARVGLLSSKVVDAVQARLPASFHYPADSEGAEMAVRDTHLDDSPARRDLGITPIPFDQSVRDEIAWAVEAGHLPEKYRPR
jgi:dihydroflavonol-4-reductase